MKSAYSKDIFFNFENIAHEVTHLHVFAFGHPCLYFVSTEDELR